MKLPYMPFWVAAYVTDTMHLNAQQSGAYLHLILHSWTNDAQPLPQDDQSLARIAKVTDKEWKAIKPVLRPFFKDGWRHSRVEREYAAALLKHEKRVAAGKASGKARASVQQGSNNAASNTKTKPKQSESYSERKIDDADERGAGMDRALKLTSEIAKVCGIADETEWPVGWYGGPLHVKGWLDGGWLPETILASVRAQMARRTTAPNTIQYFEKGIAEAHARLAAPLPTATVIPMQEATHGRRPDHIGNAIAELRSGLRSAQHAEADRGPHPDQGRGDVEIIPPRAAE